LKVVDHGNGNVANKENHKRTLKIKKKLNSLCEHKKESLTLCMGINKHE
jgi:hypothetical protein